jgi:hypothetical protein
MEDKNLINANIFIIFNIGGGGGGIEGGREEFSKILEKYPLKNYFKDYVEQKNQSPYETALNYFENKILNITKKNKIFIYYTNLIILNDFKLFYSKFFNDIYNNLINYKNLVIDFNQKNFKKELLLKNNCKIIILNFF